MNITALPQLSLSIAISVAILTLSSCSDPSSDTTTSPSSIDNQEAQQVVQQATIEPNPTTEEKTEPLVSEPNPIVGALASQGVDQDKHYTIIKSPFNDSADAVITTEFFWYGCSHCMHAEPLVQKWKTELPPNSVIEKSPAIWNALMELHARIYFIAEDAVEESKLDELHSSLFSKIIGLREDKVGLIDQKDTLRSHLANFGVDTNRFDELFDSGNMQNKIDRAKAIQRQANISGTPAFVVDGTYYLSLQALNEDFGLIDLGNTIIKAIQNKTVGQD